MSKIQISQKKCVCRNAQNICLYATHIDICGCQCHYQGDFLNTPKKMLPLKSIKIGISQEELSQLYEERDYYKKIVEQKANLNKRLCEALGIDESMSVGRQVEQALSKIRELSESPPQEGERDKCVCRSQGICRYNTRIDICGCRCHKNEIS